MTTVTVTGFMNQPKSKAFDGAATLADLKQFVEVEWDPKFATAMNGYALYVADKTDQTLEEAAGTKGDAATLVGDLGFGDAVTIQAEMYR